MQIQPGQVATVMISADEYRRLKRRERQVLGLEDFTDAGIAALEAARTDDAAKAFNSEMTSLFCFFVESLLPFH